MRNPQRYRSITPTAGTLAAVAEQSGTYDFPEPWWDDVSKEAIDLVKNLMHMDPAKRPAAREILEDAWMQADSTVLATKDLSGVRDELKIFNARRKL